MDHVTTPAAGPLCPTCQRHPCEAGRYACHPCEVRMHGWLTRELPEQLAALATVEPARGNGGPRVHVSRTAPIPGRLDVLSLTGPSAPHDGVWDPYGQAIADQHGPLPVAAVLVDWVRLTAEERHLTGPGRGASPMTLAGWLAAHLAWCCAQRWVPEMHSELDGMMRTLRGITRLTPRRRPVRQPCPRCDALALVEEDHQLYRWCGACEACFTAGELALGAAAWLARHPEAGAAA